MESYFNLCHATSLKIIEAMEVGLQISPGTLATKCIPAASELSFLYYPVIPAEKLKEGLSQRNWSHTDFGIFTLNFQDEVGGLEFEDQSQPGTFIPIIRGSPSEMILNVGDTYERWTNGVIRAPVHQVTVPTGMKNSKNGVLPERYSVAFFFKAHRGTLVGSLPEFVGPHLPAKFDNITALEFNKKRTGLLF
jgi:isopenicillin N synthase-like dioxygenase